LTRISKASWFKSKKMLSVLAIPDKALDAFVGSIIAISPIRAPTPEENGIFISSSMITSSSETVFVLFGSVTSFGLLSVGTMLFFPSFFS
jgi:hypothetical protein